MAGGYPMKAEFFGRFVGGRARGVTGDRSTKHLMGRGGVEDRISERLQASGRARGAASERGVSQVAHGAGDYGAFPTFPTTPWRALGQLRQYVNSREISGE